MDDVRRERAAVEHSAGAPRPPEDTRTVRSILSNPRENELFATFLHEKSPDLGAKLAAKEIGDAHFDELERHRGEFAERMRTAEAVCETLDDESIKSIAGSSPELKTLIQMVGPRGVGDSIRRQMTRLAIEDFDGFTRLNNQIATLRERKKTAHTRADEIARLAEENGLDARQYAHIVGTTDPEKRREVIRAAFNESRGLMSRMLDRTTGGHGMRRFVFFGEKVGNAGELATLLTKHATEIDGLETSITDAMKGVGDVLRATVRDRAEIFASLKGEMFSELPPAPRRASFADIREARRFDALRPEIDSAWSRAQAENEARSEVERLSPEALEASFRETQKRTAAERFKTTYGGGAWVMLLEILFGKNIDTYVLPGTRPAPTPAV